MSADIMASIDEIYGHGFGAHIKNLIAQYRQTHNLVLFDDFKFDIVHDIRFGDIDKNFYQKQIIALLLSQDFNHHDKALITWLIAELCKSAEHGFWVDLRSVMALLGFMLYRHMDNDDLPVLYQSKFGACADSAHSVDIEIVLGFGVDETLAYLNQHKDNHPNYATMINTIMHYDENKTAPFRTYDDYCQFFKERRFDMRQEEIAEDCGL